MDLTESLTVENAAPRRRCLRAAKALAVGLCLIATGTGVADEALWTKLKAGGQVVLIRHAVTTPGAGDPPGMRVEDCSTQRNLTDEGRAHARRIGDEWRKRGIPVDRVLSSPWCRCLETARLAFGKAEVSEALSNLFGRRENEERQVRELRALVGKHAGKGNLVLVTHGSTVAALTGLHPATGEMVILTKGAVVGRLLPP
jgi:broad specificity phosphatase PhoE